MPERNTSPDLIWYVMEAVNSSLFEVMPFHKLEQPRDWPGMPHPFCLIFRHDDIPLNRIYCSLITRIYNARPLGSGHWTHFPWFGLHCALSQLYGIGRLYEFSASILIYTKPNSQICCTCENPSLFHSCPLRPIPFPWQANNLHRITFSQWRHCWPALDAIIYFNKTPDTFLNKKQPFNEKRSSNFTYKEQSQASNPT